jgi:hypothetical protein
MTSVERFNDWSVRQYDGAEFKLNGKFYDGMIMDLSEEGIVFRPFTIDFERPDGWRPDSISVRWPDMFLSIKDFDAIELKIFDEHRGDDHGAIGSGLYDDWRNVWPIENIPGEVA